MTSLKLASMISIMKYRTEPVMYNVDKCTKTDEFDMVNKELKQQLQELE